MAELRVSSYYSWNNLTRCFANTYVGNKYCYNMGVQFNDKCSAPPSMCNRLQGCAALFSLRLVVGVAAAVGRRPGPAATQYGARGPALAPTYRAARHAALASFYPRRPAATTATAARVAVVAVITPCLVSGVCPVRGARQTPRTCGVRRQRCCWRWPVSTLFHKASPAPCNSFLSNRS